MDTPSDTGGFVIENSGGSEMARGGNSQSPCLTKVMECQVNQKDWQCLSASQKSCSSPNLNSHRGNSTQTNNLLIFQNEAAFGTTANNAQQNVDPVSRRTDEAENRRGAATADAVISITGEPGVGGICKARRPCDIIALTNSKCCQDNSQGSCSHSGGRVRGCASIQRDPLGHAIDGDLADGMTRGEPGGSSSQPSHTTGVTHDGSDRHSSASRPDLLDVESRLSGSHHRRQKLDEVTKGALHQQSELGFKRTDFGDYYPDGGWGWVICAGASVVNSVLYGVHLSGGSLQMAMERQFPQDNNYRVWLCSVSFGLCHLTAPLVVAVCRRHSPRLLGLAGALLCGLACLFISFSTEPHQVFISYSVVFAIASGITLQTSLVMVGRFFQCRRDCAEILCLSVTGLGLVAFTAFIQYITETVSWSRGTQLIGCVMLLVFAAVATYRSTALYHPRRRTIVHLKRGKKTQKQLSEFENRPSYWDFSPLRMSSFRCLLLCAFLNGLGFYAPFLLLPLEFRADQFDVRSKLVVLSFLGFSFSLGVSACGLLVLHSNQKCLVSKQYVCLTAGCVCGITTMLFAMAHGMKSYILFVVVFGISCGAFVYSLRLYVVELVTRRLAEVSLGYMHAFFGLGIILGTPAETFLAAAVVYFRVGFIAAGLCMLLGSGLMFLGSVTANHPSNHQVIQAAYLRSNLAEEKLFEEMNISESEDDDDSVTSDTNSDQESVGANGAASEASFTQCRDKSPSLNWSQLPSGTTTPASDKTRKDYHSDSDISRIEPPHVPQNLRYTNSIHAPARREYSAKSKQNATAAYPAPPPCYDSTQDLIWMKRIQDHPEGGTSSQSTSNGESDVTAIHVSSPNTKIKCQQKALVPAKTTYV